MDDFEKGWLSALIDGEGCIGLMKTDTTKAGRLVMTPHLQVKNTNAEFMQKTKSIIGKGHIHYRKSKNPKWQDSYEYYLRGIKSVLPLLKELAPFLIVKREKAKLLIEFAESRIIHGAGKRIKGKRGMVDIPYSKREEEIIHLIKD